MLVEHGLDTLDENKNATLGTSATFIQTKKYFHFIYELHKQWNWHFLP